MESTLHSIDPFESLDMCSISDDLLPSDEVFLESLIQSDLLLDVGSVVTKSKPNLPSKTDLSSYVDLVESLDSSFEQQVSDPDEFNFFSPSEVDITDYKPSSLSATESSSISSSLTLPFIEDGKVTCVSAKATCIESFLLNIILMLFILGDRILSWIHNCLLALSCC